MANFQESEALKTAFQFVTQIDLPVRQAEVEKLKSENPNASKRELATKIFSKARFRASRIGFFTGFLTNPLTMLPAAIGDVVMTINAEKNAAACVALIYEPDFFYSDKAPLELLIPVLGLTTASQVTQQFAMRAGMKQFKKMIFKVFGTRVMWRGIATKTIPVLGGLIGGGWNWIEVSAVRENTIHYFEEYTGSY